jgi:heme exporter protein B
MRAFFALVRRDLLLSLREGAGAPVALYFFVLTGVMLAFAVGPEPALLARLGAASVWLAALLAGLLAMERLFEEDARDGGSDAMLSSGMSAESVFLAKVLVHFVTTGLPMIPAAMFTGLLYGMTLEPMAWLAASLVLGTPCLSLIGAAGAAVTVGAQRGGILLALLVLPLYIPLLIFALAAVAAGPSGQGGPPLMILAAMLLASAALAPFAGGAGLRRAADDS